MHLYFSICGFGSALGSLTEAKKDTDDVKVEENAIDFISHGR